MSATRLCLILMQALAAVLTVTAAETDMLFSAIPDTGGDPHIRSIIQLGDHRPAFATETGLELFDGVSFEHLRAETGDTVPLAAYNGHFHLYLSHCDRYLWIKNRHTLQCVDLNAGCYVDSLSGLLDSLVLTDTPDDLFGDDRGRLWWVKGTNLRCPDLNLPIEIDPGRMPLLDLAADSDSLYLFYSDGSVVCHDMLSGKQVYAETALAVDEPWKSGATSHMIASDGAFYQIRNDSVSTLRRFTPAKRRWETILETDLRLNTLGITGHSALISTPRGLLSVNLADNTTTHMPLLRTRSGNMLASEISTIMIDREGGIWLGMLNRGILHYHPREFSRYTIDKPARQTAEPVLSSVFSENPDGTISISNGQQSFTIAFTDSDSVTIIPAGSIPASPMGEYGSGASFVTGSGSLLFNSTGMYEIFIPSASALNQSEVAPFISRILVNGEPMKTRDSAGNVIIPSRAGQISLDHDRNFVTVEATAPRFDGSPTTFAYKLDGVDRKWNRAPGEGRGNRRLKASYTDLSPGNYTLRIKASERDNAPETRLDITVMPPWWLTKTAIAAYILVIIAAFVAATRMYASRMRRKIAARQREENLIERIRHLIEEVDRYKTEMPVADTQPSDAATDDDHSSPTDDAMTDADRQFIARAVETVEMNLNTPGYSVERLSKDMCMDRTGLYRRLTALLDLSPSLFIRDIRLRNAARLLSEGKMSVTEIAEATGFSSTSYMSKCFQERYGCRPSDYAENR